MSDIIIKKYFEENPDDFIHVKKATYAYHLSHAVPKAHYFRGAMRDAKCMWCDRTRELVRWDDLPPECSLRPQTANIDISSVIDKEEKLFSKIFSKAEKIASEINLESLTGEYLSYLHHTEGIDPSILECALINLGKTKLSEKLHEDYFRAYELHKTTGKLGMKKQILVAKTI